MYTINTLGVEQNRALSSPAAGVTAPPAHHPMQMHNKKRFRQPRTLGIFLLGTASSRNMENCADYTAEQAEDCFDCRCSTCRIVYAIWMMGRAIMQRPINPDEEVQIQDAHQTSITKSWE
tara:strand:+ start:771 stop:1130 length:360 start_codon:yes stop_codon:yes gene_type:complete